MASPKQSTPEDQPSSTEYIVVVPSDDKEGRSNEQQYPHSISIAIPSSPRGLQVEQTRTATVTDNDAGDRSKYWRQSYQEDGAVQNPYENAPKVPRNYSFRDKTYDHFKTWSGKLERQLSNLRWKPQELEVEVEGESDASQKSGSPGSTPGVDRFFAALVGPELDTLRSSEELALPEDKLWPFLLRFPISSFGMCLGVSSQAILWKTLATAPSTKFLHVSLTVNFVLWWIAVALMATVSFIYILKIVFYFETVRREYYHPIRVNFFFAPWIACLFLAIGVPPSLSSDLPSFLWYILMTPLFCLELKIYGQWMSGGKRRLSKVANPSNHLSIVGNFVGALLGASMGLREGPIFFFAVGLAHYIVLFVTLYQRLPTSETLPKELHPVFFLFVAAPSVACMAWAKIHGEFDYGSRIAYFIALFLYMSLAVRINFFRGLKFSLAWWAYTFPMTGASIATIGYTNEVRNALTQSLSVTLSTVSTITVSALLVMTIFHAFVLKDLFPNDVSIAITVKNLKLGKKKHKPFKSLAMDIKKLAPIKSSDSNSKDFCIVIDELKDQQNNQNS